MTKNLQKFGKKLKELRMAKNLSLREACKLTDNYDPSNWSKIERGIISPPSNKETLLKWAKILGVKNSKEIEQFVDEATIAQGIIPDDILSQKDIVNLMPAFFRTLRSKKPTKEEIDRLIEIIRRN